MQKSKLIIVVIALILIDCTICQSRQQNQQSTQNPCRMQCRLIANQTHTQSFSEDKDLDEQILESCLSYCAYQQNKSSVLVTIIIVLIVLFLISSIILIGFCIFSRVKKKIILQVQFAKRRVIRTGISNVYFTQCFQSFQNIFTEQQRQQWLFFYKVGQKRIQIDWFNFATGQIAPFQSKVNILGQDSFGQCSIDGYFVHTQKGITFWGFKKYSGFQQQQANSDNNTIVFQMQQRSNGFFIGQWYFRGRQKSKGLSGEFKLVRKGMQQMINIEIEQNLDAPYQEASQSDL